MPFIPRAAFALPLFLFLASHGVLALAQPAATTGNNALKIINNAGGGQIVYGPLVRQPSLPAAMGVMLRTINYLEQTVIQDCQRNERTTVWNQYADSLVNRYQYVPAKDFIKGIDY